MFKKQFLLSLLVIFFSSHHSIAQTPIKADTLIRQLDSLARKADSAGLQVNNIHPSAYNDVTKLNGRSYLILLGSNIKQSFTKPFHMTKKDFARLGKFVLIGGALCFADETVQQNALELRQRSAFVRSGGKLITKFGFTYEFATLGGFAAYGILFKSQKVKNTTLLATQSVITALLVEATVKTLTGRTRPSYYDPKTEAEPKFLGPFGNLSKDASGKRSNSSFPSGHTTAAFSAATVFAVEYRNKPYIPVIAYSIATLVGMSRITENKHWLTDVFAGAALGYLTGRQTALNYHRYAKIKNAELRKKLSFNLRYDYGKLMPGLVWKL